MIYFLLSDLPKIHSFYKFSLDSFIIVVNRAIDYISERKIFGDTNMVPFGDEEFADDKDHHEDEDA